MYFNIHKEKCCHKSGFFSNISPRVNRRSKFRRQTYHIRDINVELNVSFHWFNIFAIILNSWDDVKPIGSVYFGVCCSASSVYSHSLWESTPTMHCMDLMHHVSYSLWADGKKRNQPINFDFGFWLRFEFFSDVDVLLLFHVILVVIEAQHAFHQQSHCVNYKHEEHCTSVAEGFHCVNTGFWCASRWTAWLGGFIFMKL